MAMESEQYAPPPPEELEGLELEEPELELELELEELEPLEPLAAGHEEHSYPEPVEPPPNPLQDIPSCHDLKLSELTVIL